MRAIIAIVRAFDQLTSKEKARWIAALCAVLGVLTGFVLYIVFTHSFESGQLWAKLIGLALGLVVAIVFARLAEWLWHTINTGEAEIGRHFAQTASTAILLVVVFELCVSAFEDFTKAAIGDYAAIQRIAAQVAGHSADPTLTADNTDFARLFDALSYSVSNGASGKAPPVGAQAVLARVAAFFEPKDSVLLFTGTVPQEEMDRLWIQLPAETLVDHRGLGFPVYAPEWVAACKGAMPRLSSTLEAADLKYTGFARAPERQQWDAKCRESIAAVSLSDRVAALPGALNHALSHHDLYDPVVFMRQNVDGHLLLPPDDPLAQRAFDQRKRCDQIRGEETVAGAKSDLDCVMFLTSDTKRAEAGPKLLQTNKMKEVNREVLARLIPEYIQPRPINWGDFLLLVCVWSVAAVVLAILLCDTVFEIAHGASTFEALEPAWLSAGTAIFFAALGLAATVILLRLVAFVWGLMFSAPPADIHFFDSSGVIWSVVSFFPNLINWLKAGGVFGLAIPGWISVPVVLGGALVVASTAKEGNLLRLISIYGLLGLWILSIGPVFQGLFGLAILVAVTWIVPAFGLATLLPYLEPGAAVPRWWGVIAFAVAVLLGLWSALMQEGDFLIRVVLAVSSIAFVVLGVLILRQRPLRDVWPLVAITVMMSFIGAASVVQQATFQGALDQLHPLTVVDQPQKETTGPFDYLFFSSIRRDSEDQQVPEAAVLDVPDEGVRQAGHLELALVGSLGFWLTLALLAAWSLRRNQAIEAAVEPHVELKPVVPS